MNYQINLFSYNRAIVLMTFIKLFVHFQDMETPFMEAVKLALGDRFTEATEKNFNLLFNYVVEQMLIGYNQAGGQPGPDSNRV